jgi:hypothetical protein
MSELSGRLTALGLRHVADNLDDLVALAQKRRLGARELIEHLVDLEEKDRARRSLERRTTRSRLGRFKPADYDWKLGDAHRSVPGRSRRPARLFRPPKQRRSGRASRLGHDDDAQNIAHQAVIAGHSVLFLNAAHAARPRRGSSEASFGYPGHTIGRAEVGGGPRAYALV